MRNNNTVAKSGTKTLSGFTGRSADIHGSVEIGVRLMFAGDTPKLVLGFAVLFCAVSTLSASPAGIARIDGDQRNTGKSGLVLKEQTQLRERPGMQNCTLPAPGLDPVTNASQFFDGNSTPGAFSFGNDLLTDIVIHPCRETPLFTREQFQSPFNGTGLFFLEFSSQSPMAMPDSLQFRTGVPLAVGIKSDIGDPKINSEELRRIDGRAGRNFHSAVEVEPALAINQIGLPFDAVEPFLLVLTVDHRDDNTTFRDCPQADFIDALESQNAFVVRDRAVRFEYRTDRFIAGETLNGFADCTDCHLCGQTESGSNFSVGQFVDRRLAKDPGIKPTAGSESRCFIRALHRFQELRSLSGIGKQPQLERQFQYLGVYRSVFPKATRKASALFAESPFLPMPEGRSFPETVR
jgi:hypothetical protein